MACACGEPRPRRARHARARSCSVAPRVVDAELRRRRPSSGSQYTRRVAEPAGDDASVRRRPRRRTCTTAAPGVRRGRRPPSAIGRVGRGGRRSSSAVQRRRARRCRCRARAGPAASTSRAARAAARLARRRSPARWRRRRRRRGRPTVPLGGQRHGVLVAGVPHAAVADPADPGRGLLAQWSRSLGAGAPHVLAVPVGVDRRRRTQHGAGVWPARARVGDDSRRGRRAGRCVGDSARRAPAPTPRAAAARAAVLAELRPSRGDRLPHGRAGRAHHVVHRPDLVGAVDQRDPFGVVVGERGELRGTPARGVPQVRLGRGHAADARRRGRPVLSTAPSAGPSTSDLQRWPRARVDARPSTLASASASAARPCRRRASSSARASSGRRRRSCAGRRSPGRGRRAHRSMSPRARADPGQAERGRRRCSWRRSGRRST